MFKLPWQDCGRVRVLRVHNYGMHDISALYVAPHGAGAWGPDQLMAWLRPNEHVDVVLSEANGSFDVRAVYHDGHEHVVAEVRGRVADVDFSY